MPVETEGLANRLDGVVTETVAGWTFWRGTLDGYPVVVSKTGKGAANVAAATAIGVERYHPVAVVNQGTAGGHDPELHVYDIVLGSHSVNLGAFKTAYRERGQGSNPLEWKPMDLLASEASAGQDPAALTMRRFDANAELLAAAEGVKPLYKKGRVVTGVIGPARSGTVSWIALLSCTINTTRRSRRWRRHRRRKSLPPSRCRSLVFVCCPTTSPTRARMTPELAKRVRTTSIRS